MENKIFDDYGLKIFVREGFYYLQYDAGAHQVAIREDRISEQDAVLVMQSRENAMKVLLALQKKLIDSGVKPYKSNLK